MLTIVVEDDPYLRLTPVLLDPSIPKEHRRAVQDFMAHDVDLDQWILDFSRRLPGLRPARVLLALDQEDLRTKLPEADAVIVEALKIGPAEIALAPRLSIVSKFGALAGNIDREACEARGVAVHVQRRRVNVAVAEQAFALMICLARRMTETNGKVSARALTEAGFDPTPYDRRYTTNSNYARISHIRALNGAIFGAIGMGEIGREVAARAAAFGMQVIYTQRSRMNEADESRFGAAYVSLDELMRRADFISMHLPLNDSTRNIIDRRTLDLIKPGAIMVNIARAQLVERQALLGALRDGRLGGYGLDVGYDEPAREDEPLLDFKNVILTPHLAVAERQNGLLDMEEICESIWRAALRDEGRRP